MKKINKKGEKGRWEETEGRERGVGDFLFFIIISSLCFFLRSMKIRP